MIHASIKRAEELFSDKKNDFFSALYTFVKNVFVPFPVVQLPFYPTYDTIHGSGVGYTLLASYVISETAYLVNTRIAEEESGLALTDRTKDAACAESERISSAKVGRDSHTFRGVIVNVAVDKNKIHTMNTRIARAAVLWLLENMTETQKQCYRDRIRDGMMVNIYHVEGSCEEDHADNIYPSIDVGIQESISCKKYINLFPPHTWLHMSTLQPYLDKLSSYIIEKNKEEAKVIKKFKPEVKDLLNIYHRIIPEACYANTLLIAPSQEDTYAYLLQILRENHTMHAFAKVLLASLDIQHVAICAKANTRPYLAKGARAAESVDLARAGYRRIQKHGFIFIPYILDNLLNINNVKTKFFEQLQKENVYEIDRGMYKHYTCYYQSAARLIKSLPNGSEISDAMDAETQRIQQHVIEVFNKLSVSDKIVLYDADVAGNSVLSRRGMLEPSITANQVLYEKLNERLLKLLEKAENILLNKFLPKLNLVWNPKLDCNTNDNK